MADPDAENRLLDGIIGKYGEDGDFDDLGNADEEALLEGYDDTDSGEVKHYNAYQHREELDPEPEELEDVLDLEAQDVELEEDEVDRSSHNLLHSGTVSSTTQFETDAISYKNNFQEKQRNTDKFKNERQMPSSISNNIPDSLDIVDVKNTFRNVNRTVRGGQARKRNKNGNMRNNYNQQKGRLDNKTVLINPHFKGQVHINSDARLAWDARHRINQNKSQIGKVAPFSQTTRSEPTHAVQPWISNVNIPHNMPQYSQQPPSPAYPPVFQPPPPQPTWNPPSSPSWTPPPSSFNQVPPQQHVFMQPLPPPPMVYNNSSFNQAGPLFNPPPMYQQNQVLQLPSMFQSPQFGPPPNQFGPPPDSGFNSGYLSNHPSSIVTPMHNNNYNYPSPLVNSQFNSSVNRFMDNHPINQGNLRYINSQVNSNQCKPQFNQRISPSKRKVDVPDIRKKKRNLASGNLHEVTTVETPDTTVKEEKQQEDDDDETRAYRKRIEEQKKLREKFLEQKELRRQQAAKKLNHLDVTSTDTQPLPKSQGQQRSRSTFQRNLQVVKISQSASATNVPDSETASENNVSITKFGNNQLQNRNNKAINMENETKIDKQHLASFLSNRKILAKDQSLIDTSIVVVSNLAAGTTDVKLHKLCQGIGEIKPTWSPPSSPSWSPPPSSFNQVHPKQHVFMQSLRPPPMVHNNSFNQPGSLFNPPPMYQQNQVLQLPSVFQGPQFGFPPKQFGSTPDFGYLSNHLSSV